MTQSSLSISVAQRITGRFAMKSPEDKSVAIVAGRFCSRKLLLVGQVLAIGGNNPSSNPHSTSCNQELNLLFI
jgi:hypothetical protein